MKKTVQIVTIPLNKNGFSNDDLLFNMTDKRYFISDTAGIGSNISAQQLLVLSDDEIQGNNWFYSIESNTIFEPINMNRRINFGFNFCKIVASYPNIPNTLPLSKETIQQWIDNGTPVKGSVDIGKFYTGNYIHKCKTCNKEYIADKRWYRCKECSEKQLITDSQGNLILEFNRSLEEVMDSVFSKWDDINKIVYDFLESKVQAPIVPTDEEIIQTAKVFVEKAEMTDTFHSKTKDEIADYNYYFVQGYKQALKDLRYDN